MTSGPCDLNNTAWLERRVVGAVATEFGKTPAGWEQVLFKTHAATNDTIVYGTTSATLFWTLSHASTQLDTTPHAPCGMPC